MKKGIFILVFLLIVGVLNFPAIAQNCLQSASNSYVDACGNCVFENDVHANACSNTQYACAGDTLNIYLNTSISLSSSDSLPQIIRSQIEADFCANGGNIIDCYCNLLPELETFLIQHTFLQNGDNNNSQILDFLNFEDDYLRIILALDTQSPPGEVIYEIDLQRDIIMNCYLCNDEVCIDQNIGIPLQEKQLIPIQIQENCQTATASNFIAQQQLSVFPNPATHFLTLSMPNENSTITIFNIQAQLIAHYQNTSTIDVQDLKSGLYFIQVNAKNTNWQSTFVKL